MNSQDILNIPLPEKYKNKWYIWKDTVLDFIEIADCADTQNGICLSGKNLYECIDECNSGCSAGYHIEFNSGKTICVPIRTDIHPKLNPVYRLRKKILYPELKNVKISTFVDTNVFPFPPNLSNSVFYRDILSIENIDTSKLVDTRLKVEFDNQIYLDDNHGIYEDNNDKNLIQVVQSQSSAIQVNNYYPVCYGDHIQFCIPNTSFFIKESEYGKLKWEFLLEILHGNDMEFQIVPIDSNHKIGDIITYGDVFAIEYSNTSIVSVNPEYQYLELIYDNLSDILKNKNKNIKFKFVSKMNGYYCDNNVCKDIPIKDIEKSGKSGIYKGVPVSRHPGCWGLCDKKLLENNYVKNNNKSKIKLLYLIIITLSIIGIFFLYMCIRRYNIQNKKYR